MSSISWGVNPGISKLSERSSLRVPILHFSASGILKYFIEFFTMAGVSESLEEVHSTEIRLMVLPITVRMSFLMVLANTLMQYLGLEHRDFTKPMYRLANMTLGWSDSEIDSIRYLWVVFVHVLQPHSMQWRVSHNLQRTNSKVHFHGSSHRRCWEVS